MQANIIQQHDLLIVNGTLNFWTIMSLYQQSLKLIANCSVLNFDLSKTVAMDSSGLALLLAWLQLAKKHNKKIMFHHIPHQLLKLAKTAEVAGLLE